MTKPNTPRVEEDVVQIEVPDLDQVEFRRRGWMRSGGWLIDPARLEFTALATRRMLKLSRDIGLGEERPTRAIVAPDRDQANLYVVPTAVHPKAHEITYPDGRAAMNLYTLLLFLDRLVEPNTKEFYTIEFSDRPVSIEGKTTKALVISFQRPAAKVQLPKGGKAKKTTGSSDQAKSETKTEAKIEAKTEVKTEAKTEANAKQA